MSTATITLYKSSKIISTRNMKIDSIETYLSTKTYITKSKVQYQRPNILEFNFKLDLSQDYVNFSDVYDYDYCKIINTNSNKPLYYFITKRSWKSESTIEFHVVLDTINSFVISVNSGVGDYVITKRTNVLREHKNRWTGVPDSEHEITNTFFQHEYNFYGDGIIDVEFYNDDIFADNDNIEVIEGYSTSDISNIIEMLWDTGDEELVEGVDYEVLEMNVEWVNQFQEEANNGELWPKRVHLKIEVTSEKIDPSDPQLFKLQITSNYYIDKHTAIIDFQSEGIQPVLYKTELGSLVERADTTWNLIYKTSNVLSTEENNPVSCFMLPSDNSFKVVTSDGTIGELDKTELTALYPQSYWFSYAPRKNPKIFNSTCPYPVTFLIKYDNGTKEKRFTLSWEDYSGRTSRQNVLVVQKYTEGGIDKVRVYLVGVIYDYSSPLVVRSASYTTKENIEDVSKIIVENLDESIQAYLQPDGNHLYYPEDDVYDEPNVTISVSNGTEEVNLGTLDQYDRTESTLIKIISLPYCPSDFTYDEEDNTFEIKNDWDFSSSYSVPLYELKSTNVKFNHIVQSTLFNPIFYKAFQSFPIIKEVRNDDYETKLFHSDYYQLKFIYDSFSYVFQMETIDFEKSIITSEFRFTFIMTSTINSRFLFRFDDYVLYKTTMDYDNICAVARNNEETIYNSTYLTYLRNGYNYDVKARDRSIASSSLGLGASILGTAVGIAVGVATENPAVLISSIVAGTSSIITSSVATANSINATEQALEQRKIQYQSQAVSVSGSDDIDLLTAYSGNRAKLVEYKVSDRMRKALADLFFYTGYVCNERKIPQFNTRRYFNFVQMEIDVLETSGLTDEVINDLTMRWKNGVTIYHQYNGEYDIEQIYENWEVNFNG